MHAMHKLVKVAFLMNRQIQATRWSTQVSGLTIHYVISDVVYVYWQTYIRILYALHKLILENQMSSL